MKNIKIIVLAASLTLLSCKTTFAKDLNNLKTNISPNSLITTTQWKYVNNNWYYFSQNGAKQTGWLKDDNKWYYLNEDGSIKIGWLNLNDKTYFLGTNGDMQTGWVSVNNKTYYFYPDGSMAKNTVIENREIGPTGFVTLIFNNIETKCDKTLDEFVDIQDKHGKPEIYDEKITEKFKFRKASKEEIKNCINPKTFVENKTFRYMFMKLSYTEGLTAEQLNEILKDKGVLSGKGEVFLEAGKKANVNPIYLISHALQETANGTSKLATGIEVDKIYSRQKSTDAKGQTTYVKKLEKEVTKRTVYNVYGAGSFIDDAILWGANAAYKNSWFSIDESIIGGAKWIADGYISQGQDTLYKMKWDLNYKASPWTNPHQYATDVAWAKQQTYRIKELVDKMSAPSIVFEVPVFKEN